MGLSADKVSCSKRRDLYRIWNSRYGFVVAAACLVYFYCGRPWPAAYININQNTHQIQVLTEALCRAQAIFYSLPNNEWGTKYRGLTYSAK